MITVEYLLQLGACWPREQLEAAAELWPGVRGNNAPRCCTLAWFLGERLQAMETRDVLLRFDIAVAHVSRLTMNAAQAMDLAQAFELAERAKVCAAELRAPRPELDPNPAALIATLAELGVILTRIDGEDEDAP